MRFINELCHKMQIFGIENQKNQYSILEKAAFSRGIYFSRKYVWRGSYATTMSHAARLKREMIKGECTRNEKRGRSPPRQMSLLAFFAEIQRFKIVHI